MCKICVCRDHVVLLSSPHPTDQSRGLHRLRVGTQLSVIIMVAVGSILLRILFLEEAV
jgi:hypothetical protein